MGLLSLKKSGHLTGWGNEFSSFCVMDLLNLGKRVHNFESADTSRTGRGLAASHHGLYCFVGRVTVSLAVNHSKTGPMSVGQCCHFLYLDELSSAGVACVAVWRTLISDLSVNVEAARCHRISHRRRLVPSCALERPDVFGSGYLLDDHCPLGHARCSVWRRGLGIGMICILSGAALWG